MTDSVRLEIAEFDASQPLVSFRGSNQGPESRNWSVAFGIACTLCLHAMLIQLLDIGFGAHAPRTSERQGAFADQANSTAAPAEELVLIAVDDAPRDKFDIAQQIGRDEKVVFEIRPVKLFAPQGTAP